MNAPLVRPATPGDLDAIARIQAASLEASQWKPADYLGYLCFVAATETGEVTGFLAARAVAADEHELLNLAVDAAARRQGVARALLEHVFASTPPGAWFLEVRASNAAAIRLYEHFGFRPNGVRPGYYTSVGSSPESAIVMHRSS